MWVPLAARLGLSLQISYRQKYLLHLLIQVNQKEGHIRDDVELVNHFQQEKISLQYIGTLATKNYMHKSKCPIKSVKRCVVEFYLMLFLI